MTTTWEPDLVAPVFDEDAERLVAAAARDAEEVEDHDAVVALLHNRLVLE